MDSGQSLHQARTAAMRIIHSPLVQDRDDETGVILDDLGCLPAEALGRHCKHCGNDLFVSLARGGSVQPGSVQEYQHAATALVHCVLAFQGGVPVVLAEETAEPCWREGCLLGNAGQEARTGGASQ